MRARRVAITIVLFAPQVAAEEGSLSERLHLVWNAPAECPTRVEVEAAIGPAANRSTKARVLEVDAKVERSTASDGWRVRLATRRGTTQGERAIEASSCEGIAQATAVVLALALEEDPAAAGDGPSTVRVVGATEVDGVHAGDGDAARTAPRTRPSTRRDVLAIGASFVVDPTTLPALAAGAGITLAWTPERWRLEIDARRWAAQSHSVSTASAGAEFALTSIGARGCRGLVAGAFELAPCAGVDVQVVSATGYGAQTNYEPDGLWTTLAFGALARWRFVDRVALRSRIEGVVPLARPAFVVENVGLVHRSPTIGAAASLGVEVHFL